jgi:predicted TIM-barrel fold metal-dependent hydrolase
MHVLNRDTIRFDVLFKKLKLPGSSLMGLAIAGDDVAPITKWVERLIKIYKRLPYFDVDKILDMFQMDPQSYARQMLRDMDAAGVDKAFLLMVPQDTYRQQEASYEAYVKAIKESFYGRLMLFYGARLNRIDERDIVRMCQGVVLGFKLYPALAEASDTVISQIFSIAKRCGKSIIIHGNQGGIGKYKKQNKPEFWAPWLEKYPTVNFCFAHAGGEFTKDTQKIVDLIKVNEMNNVFIDLAFHSGAMARNPNPYFRKLRALQAEIPGHIIGGITDYPLGSTNGTIKMWHDRFKQELGDYNYTEIFSYNVERFLGE